MVIRSDTHEWSQNGFKGSQVDFPGRQITKFSYTKLCLPFDFFEKFFWHLEILQMTVCKMKITGYTSQTCTL